MVRTAPLWFGTVWADGQMERKLPTTIEIDGDFITSGCVCQSESQLMVRGKEEIYSKSSYISTVSISGTLPAQREDI
jgi:hypothetical protein